MCTREKYITERFLNTTLRLAMLGLILLATASTADAVEYWVSGQVVQVNAEAAQDEDVSDVALSGAPRPFARVRLIDADTETVLGEIDSDSNGQFTVRYDRPLGSTPNVRVRVVHLVEDEATSLVEAYVLPPARDDINTFDSAPRFLLATNIKVLAEDSLDYGNMSAEEGLVSTPGVGLVFTRVGKVETQFITPQDASSLGGLADFTSDPSAPASLGVPNFIRAPFGGQIFVYGDFGLPQDACTGEQIDYYQVTITKPGGTQHVFKQPLPKTKTIVSPVPPVTIVHQRGPVGPFSGTDGALTVDGLYWVNRNNLAANTFYSFPDLRLNWKTYQLLDPSDSSSGPENGVYEINVKYYKKLAGDIDNPTIDELDPGCFMAPTPLVGRIFLHVENRPITASFDHIYLKNPGNGRYLASDGSEVAGTGGALDYNFEGLCNVMALESTYEVEIHYTVNHPGGFLRSYALTASPNDSSVSSVTFQALEGFGTHTTVANPRPVWNGPGSTSDMAGGFDTCAYIFDLVAGYRQHDGERYRNGEHRRRTYYVSE
ncbi:MAG: hypothetical protein GY906_05170 [bacterium]|nr:hypothetical protein [bacterium]